MPRSQKFGGPARVVLLLGGLSCALTGHEIPSNPPGALNSSTSALAACPARSINYITDTLPQQCLSTGGIEVRPFAPLRVEETSLSAKDVESTTSDEGKVTGLPLPLLQIPYVVPSTSGNNADSQNANSATRSVSEDPSSSATKVSAQSVTTVDTELGNVGDSPLDEARFLSFEEWKKQNLAKAGQTLDNIAGRKEIGDRTPGRRPATINNALDSLGEDSEIEIDFGGFVNPGSTAPVVTPAGPGTRNNKSDEKLAAAAVAKSGGNLPGTRIRSKDAGKTCKERFNYASFDCGATVLKTNKECKGSTSVLVENKDSYMLNQCSADNKFFIVELCDNILVDTVVLANFEFFSSMFRSFRVSVSDQYPVKLEKWKELGTFEARNSREVQAFLVESPLIWARYLRIEFLAHYGSEYYCPVSLLRVHGTTMMEEFNHDMKGLRGEEEADGEIGEGAGEEVELTSDSGVVLADALKKEKEEPAPESAVQVVVENALLQIPQPVNVSVLGPLNKSKPTYRPTEFTNFEPLLPKQLQAIMQSLNDEVAVCAPEDFKLAPPAVSTAGGQIHPQESPGPAHPPSLMVPTEIPAGDEHRSRPTASPAAESIVSTGASEIMQIKTTISSVKTAISTPSPGLKSHTPTQPPTANPTTQESFFKTVHKRLQILEANSTLSLQYIEDQSRILRDAFTKVEKRQLHKMTTFLESLNTTVLTEIRHLQAQYDQLWQSTVLEFSAQRESSRQEIVALSDRLSLLADETLFQKRIAILQSMLILLCLSLIIFTRASSFSSSTSFFSSTSSSPRPSTPHDAAYAELSSSPPSSRNKSSANQARNAYLETPNSSPSSSRPSSQYGKFGRGQENLRSPSQESRRRDRSGTKTASAASNGGVKTMGRSNGTSDGG